MYDALGYGKGDTILAAFVLGIGIPAYVPLPPTVSLYPIAHMPWSLDFVSSISMARRFVA